MQRAAGRAHARRLGAACWWLGILAAVVLSVATMRYREAADAHCLPIPPPQAAGFAGAGGVPLLRHDFHFDAPRATRPSLALVVGAALPFARIELNGADLTPAIDLAARDVRELAPQLQFLPDELLRQNDNVLRITLPQLAALGPTRLEQVCVAARSALEPAFRANWWRMVLVPRACLLLLIALALLALVLWLISDRQPAYLWYALCLTPLAERNLYLSMPYRPGGPLAWIWLDDASLLLIPLALYHLMRAHWQFRSRTLGYFIGATSALALAGCALRGPLAAVLPSALLDAGPLLIVVINGAAIAIATVRHASAMHRVERRVVIGIFAYAAAVGVLEIGYFVLPFEQRWMWSSALATVVLALGLGYLLIRRMAVGGYVLAAATATLADDLDQAIAAEALQPERLWAEVAAGVSQRERRRLLRDIHDGFGSRLVSVLARARRELGETALQRQIQRALVDMRLMLDALDDSSPTLASAMARLRHRIEQANPPAADCCAWRLEGIDEVVIGDRHRLIAVYRCLEELLGECFEHDPRAALTIRVEASRHHARFVVSGGRGDWSAATIDRVHRVMGAVDGGFALCTAAAATRYAQFSVPLF